jgi:hypothetical protein
MKKKKTKEERKEERRKEKKWRLWSPSLAPTIIFSGLE